MKQMFVLNKTNIELSKNEVLRLYDIDKYHIIDNLLIIETTKDYSDRLAYTKAIYDVVFETKKETLEKDMENYDWNKIYHESFSLGIKGNHDFDKKRLAGYIWHNVNDPKVNLKAAMTNILIYVKDDLIICSVLRVNIDKGYLKRKAHLRPSLHPTSLDPQLARACINLTGKPTGKFLDPFCGSGGILIEAGLMGYDISGYDIDKIMLKRAGFNLDHYGIKDYHLKLTDSTKENGKFDLIVTDLPYAKSSRISAKLDELYRNFVDTAYEMTDVMVVMLPEFENKEVIINDMGKWKKKFEFKHYLHKTLSKRIVLLEKY